MEEGIELQCQQQNLFSEALSIAKMEFMQSHAIPPELPDIKTSRYFLFKVYM